MTNLSYTDIQKGVFFRMGGETYQVIFYTFKKELAEGINADRIKNLKTGRVVFEAFHISDSFREVVTKKRMLYMYIQGDGRVVHLKDNPFKKVFVPINSNQDMRLVPSGAAVTTPHCG